MSVSELDRVTDVSPWQKEKALAPMVVTELGVSMAVRFLQLLKALSPIVTRELDNLTVCSLEHREKAFAPIDVTELGIVRDFSK